MREYDLFPMPHNYVRKLDGCTSTARKYICISPHLDPEYRAYVLLHELGHTVPTEYEPMTYEHEQCADRIALAVLSFFGVPYRLPAYRSDIAEASATVVRDGYAKQLDSFSRMITATILLEQHEIEERDAWILQGCSDKMATIARLPAVPAYCSDAVGEMVPSYTPQESVLEKPTFSLPISSTSSFSSI